MKTAFVVLLVLTLFASAMAQTPRTNAAQPNKKPGAVPTGATPNLADLAYTNFLPKDPWRVINGVKNYAKVDGWVQFRGTVLQSTSDGVRIKGGFHRPGGTSSEVVEFIVKNYPYRVVVGERLDHNLTAKEAGDFTYPTVSGEQRTIRALDYGQVISTPPPPPAPTPAEVKAAQAAAASDKATKQAELIQKYESLAANGDAHALFLLGNAYLTGDGVEKDAPKAKELLKQAAAAGNLSAKAALEKMDK